MVSVSSLYYVERHMNLGILEGRRAQVSNNQLTYMDLWYVQYATVGLVLCVHVPTMQAANLGSLAHGVSTIVVLASLVPCKTYTKSILLSLYGATR